MLARAAATLRVENSLSITMQIGGCRPDRNVQPEGSENGQGTGHLQLPCLLRVHEHDHTSEPIWVMSCAGILQVDAHTTVMTIVSCTYTSVPFGLGNAATIRVGNLLGDGQGSRPQLAGTLPCLLALHEAACASICRVQLLRCRPTPDHASTSVTVQQLAGNIF